MDSSPPASRRAALCARFRALAGCALLALVAFANPPTAVAQGAINFNNKVAGAVDAPFRFCFGPTGNPTGLGEIPGMKAILMLVGDNGKLERLSDAVPFRTSPPAATPYFDGGVVYVPGNQGTPVTVRVHFFDGATIESSLISGHTLDFTVTPTLLPNVPADLTGLGKQPPYLLMPWGGNPNCPGLYLTVRGENAAVVGYVSGPTSEDLVIPETYEERPVTEIGLSLSLSSGVSSVFIPQSVRNIAPSAFSFGVALRAIRVDPRNAFYASVEGVLFDKARKTLIHNPAEKGGSYAIPEGITLVSDGAFLFANLDSVTLPDSVLSIGGASFRFCRNMTNAMLGRSITNIGNYAFSENVRLASIVVPDTVQRIGEGAFQGCENLSRAVIGAGVQEIGYYAFSRCRNLTSVLFTGNAPQDLGDLFLGSPATVYYLPEAKGWGATFGGVPTAVWDPRAEELSVGVDGFGFGIRGAARLPVVIEATGSLGAPVWEAVGTNVLSEAGLGVFREANAAGWPSRFYRFRFP